MDHVIDLINAGADALFAAAMTWAVLTHRVRDGVVIKGGLISMAMGCLVSALLTVDRLDCFDLELLGRARLLVNLGAIVVGLGLALHWRAGRRLKDLVDLSAGRAGP